MHFGQIDGWPLLPHMDLLHICCHSLGCKNTKLLLTRPPHTRFCYHKRFLLQWRTHFQYPPPRSVTIAENNQTRQIFTRSKFSCLGEEQNVPHPGQNIMVGYCSGSDCGLLLPFVLTICSMKTANSSGQRMC